MDFIQIMDIKCVLLCFLGQNLSPQNSRFIRALARKIGDMICERVPILYLLFLWWTSELLEIFRCRKISLSLFSIVSDYAQLNYSTICKKISSRIYALKRIGDFVDQKTLTSVYNAIIHPYSTYCCEIWDVFGGQRLSKNYLI